MISNDSLFWAFSPRYFARRWMARHSQFYCQKSCCCLSFSSFFPLPPRNKWTLLMHHYLKLNTCRNSKLQYTRRRFLRDYIQHYSFYRPYPIKQKFLSARIAKLAETSNYWSQITLDVIKSVRVLLDTKGLKRNIRIFTRIFAEILIGG